jgi:hypothetical protein
MAAQSVAAEALDGGTAMADEANDAQGVGGVPERQGAASVPEH